MARLPTLKPRIATLGQRVPTGGGSWRDGKTTNERGYTYAWQKARERFLAQHPLCERCQAAGRAAVATIVDHKTPHRGDMALFWDESNWEAMCKPHHDSEKQREERAG